MQEMSSMGIGNKPCLDIRPSVDQIKDRSISVDQLSRSKQRRSLLDVVISKYCILNILYLILLFILIKNNFTAAPRFRNSIVGPSTDTCRSSKRPHSIISVSSISTSSSSSAGSTGTTTNVQNIIGFDANCDSPKPYHRTGTLNSQCSVGK